MENYTLKKKRTVGNLSSFVNNIPSLGEESKGLCEGKVTKDDCYKVLKEMKGNKSPGNDGFTVEFYCTSAGRKYS